MTTPWPGVPFSRGRRELPGSTWRPRTTRSSAARTPAEGTRLRQPADEGMKIWNERGHLERNWKDLDVARKIAEQRGISMGQVAIAWVLGRPAVTSVILGARTLDQLNDNLAAGDMQLSADETRLLDEASEPGTPDYPYGEKGQTQRSRRISGGRF